MYVSVTIFIQWSRDLTNSLGGQNIHSLDRVSLGRKIHVKRWGKFFSKTKLILFEKIPQKMKKSIRLVLVFTQSHTVLTFFLSIDS